MTDRNILAHLCHPLQLEFSCLSCSINWFSRQRQEAISFRTACLFFWNFSSCRLNLLDTALDLGRREKEQWFLRPGILPHDLICLMKPIYLLSTCWHMPSSSLQRWKRPGRPSGDRSRASPRPPPEVSTLSFPFLAESAFRNKSVWRECWMVPGKGFSPPSGLADQKVACLFDSGCDSLPH